MKLLALLAVVVSASYFYGLWHPEVAAKYLPRRLAPASAAAHAPKPRTHYHSPLDASNSGSSTGYYSAEPPERYETTGQRATASGRAALLNPLRSSFKRSPPSTATRRSPAATRAARPSKQTPAAPAAGRHTRKAAGGVGRTASATGRSKGAHFVYPLVHK